MSQSGGSVSDTEPYENTDAQGGFQPFAGPTTHPVTPFRAADGRARCKGCNGTIVGTPAGWFHCG